MTRFLSILILLSASLFCGAFARDYALLPAEFDGSMMPYDFSVCDSLPDIPEGYTPVHVSYVARHGARFLSSYKKISKLEKHLYEAAKEGKLTTEGEEFFGLLKSIASSTDGRWGLLSEVGIEEEKRLGADMARMFPELLGRGRVEAISTYVPRVIMTMYQFMHSMERPHQKLEIYTSSGIQNDSLLRCFDTYAEYSEFRDSGAWKPVYDEFVKKTVSPEPARRLFGKYYDNNVRKLRDLTMEMYGVLQSCRAAGLPGPTTRWMTPEEYRSCWLASNMVHYLRNTPNRLDDGCAPATAMLIRRIEEDADKALAEKPSVNPLSGYFGHAETLLPLLSTMGLPGCYAALPESADPALASSYETLWQSWQIQDVTPLGANLTLIFLKEEGQQDNPAATVYVSVRLNGRNVPAFPGAKAITEWESLKAYWNARIERL